MAFKEVELTEEEKQAMTSGGSFFKFNAIGDRIAGVFLRTQPRTGQYAKTGQLTYVFKAKNAEGQVVELLCDPPTDAAARLKKAQELKDGDALKLVPGKKMILTYVSNQDVGKESPMKIFKLQVDDAPPSSTAAAPKPPPKPAEDDIDF